MARLAGADEDGPAQPTELVKREDEGPLVLSLAPAGPSAAAAGSEEGGRAGGGAGPSGLPPRGPRPVARPVPVFGEDDEDSEWPPPASCYVEVLEARFPCLPGVMRHAVMLSCGRVWPGLYMAGLEGGCFCARCPTSTHLQACSHAMPACAEPGGSGRGGPPPKGGSKLDELMRKVRTAKTRPTYFSGRQERVWRASWMSSCSQGVGAAEVLHS